MKKIIAFVLALMLALLSGCALLPGKGGTEPTAEATSTAEPAATPTAPPVDSDAILDRVNEGLDNKTASVLSLAGDYGNTPSNLSAGGKLLEMSDGTVIVATDAGIFAYRDGEPTLLTDDIAKSLNYWDGCIYYIGVIYGEDEYGCIDQTGATLMRINPDGTNRTMVLPEEKISYIYSYNDDGGSISTTQYIGYRDLMLYKGQLYYVANNGRPGTMKASFLNAHWDDFNTEETQNWESGQSLYRCELDGTNVTEIADLGQTSGHFTIAGDSITYTYSVDNPYFSYPFVNFFSCGLDGSKPMRLASAIYENPDNAFDSSLGQLNEIVEGLFRVEDELYVLCADSEGDFAKDRLMVLDDDGYRLLREEYFYVPTIVNDEGRLIGFFCDSGISSDVDEDGVYGMEYLTEPYIYSSEVGDDDIENKLYTFATVSRFEDEFSIFELYAFGDNLYLISKAAVYRVENNDLISVGNLPLAD